MRAHDQRWPALHDACPPRVASAAPATRILPTPSLQPASFAPLTGRGETPRVGMSDAVKPRPPPFVATTARKLNAPSVPSRGPSLCPERRRARVEWDQVFHDPVMPVFATPELRHHPHSGTGGRQVVPVFVARPVTKDEIKRTPLAQQAVALEWKRLQDMRCWEVDKVREWREVKAEARRTGQVHHVGRVFALCHEKNAELPPDHPNRKFKGRVVFQGNHVKTPIMTGLSFRTFLATRPRWRPLDPSTHTVCSQGM